MAMTRREKGLAIANGFLALLVALVLYAVIAPGIAPANWHSGQPIPQEPPVFDMAAHVFWAAVVGTPVVAVVVGRARSRTLERVGWLVLALLTVMTFTH